MRNMITRLWKEEEGQGMVEYGLIIALVAIIAMVGLKAMGPKIDEVFDNIVTALTAG